MLSHLFGLHPHKRFWKWFEDHADALAAVRSGEDPLLQKLNRELRRVHPWLAFELGLGDDEQPEFSVSADGIRSVFPIVEELVAAAPVLQNWKIIAFRQPKDSVSEIRYENYYLKAEDVWFSHKIRMNKIDLTLYIPDLSPENEAHAIGASFILLDNALGEYLVATGIGVIDHKPLPDQPAARGFKPLSEIATIIAKR